MFANKVVIVLGLAMLSTLVCAAPVYKTVDEYGNVQYTSVPPAKDAQEMKLPPGPTQQQVEEARQRNEAAQRQVEEMRRDREQAAKQAREQQRSEPARPKVETVEDSGSSTYYRGPYNRPRPTPRPTPRPRPTPLPSGR